MFRSFSNDEVAAKYASYPTEVRDKLLTLRELIFQVAAKDPAIGPLEEELKWNEPSFLTNETKSGTTIRMDWKKKDPEHYHLYFNCQTTLLSVFRSIYPEDFSYVGKRAISIPLNARFSKKKLSHLISLALTYHLNGLKSF